MDHICSTRTLVIDIEVEENAHALLRTESFCNVRIAEVHTGAFCISEFAFLRCLVMHLLNLVLDTIGDDQPLIDCDEAPVLRPLPEVHRAHKKVVAQHFSVQHVFVSDVLAARQHHVVRHELRLLAPEDSKLHLQVVHPLGASSSTVHLRCFYTDLLWQAQLHVTGDVVFEGHVPEALGRQEELQPAGISGAWAAHKIPRQVLLLLHGDHGPARQRHVRCPQRRFPALCPLHEPKLHLHVLQQHGESVRGLDGSCIYPDAASGRDALVLGPYVASSLPLEEVGHRALVPYTLVNEEVLVHSCR
mmetsp:Transcript_34520/g.46974  ORF Transcript_34520/g.46974 Transcript_34520/m.46974 type:complete len:303 (+) Transcript_34520:95-1003(+)